jgi:hypothetical protein
MQSMAEAIQKAQNRNLISPEVAEETRKKVGLNITSQTGAGQLAPNRGTKYR